MAANPADKTLFDLHSVFEVDDDRFGYGGQRTSAGVMEPRNHLQRIAQPASNQETKLMTISNAMLDEAFALCNEFGPGMLTPREERLRNRFQGLSNPEMEIILKQMDEVSQTVSSLVTQGGPAKLGKEAVTEVLQQKHPFLQKEGLQRAVFLVDYLAWHDGYDK